MNGYCPLCKKYLLELNGVFTCPQRVHFPSGYQRSHYGIQCQYCHQTLTDGASSGFFTCQNHPVRVSYLCSSVTQDDEIIISINYKYYMIYQSATQFDYDINYLYQLIFDLNQQSFVLWRKDKDSNTVTQGKKILSLNYLPEFPPEQAADYLDKLLNLLVFS